MKSDKDIVDEILALNRYQSTLRRTRGRLAGGADYAGRKSLSVDIRNNQRDIATRQDILRKRGHVIPEGKVVPETVL